MRLPLRLPLRRFRLGTAPPAKSPARHRRRRPPSSSPLLPSSLRRCRGHLFSKPVDTVLYQCPDYYDIVKQPMDFETLAKLVADRWVLRGCWC